MKAQLINLGRNKVNKTVEVKNTKELHKEIQRHILSKGWGMEEDDSDPTMWVIEAGYRTIGHVKIIEE